MVADGARQEISTAADDRVCPETLNRHRDGVSNISNFDNSTRDGYPRGCMKIFTLSLWINYLDP
jgi:hypothetical protein